MPDGSGAAHAGGLPAMARARRGLLAGAASAAALLAAGCGFEPLYAPGGAAAGLRGTIAAAEPDNHDGFVFVSHLERRLGRAVTPTYRLDYLIQTRSEGVGLTPQAETRRYNLFGAVTYRLSEADTGREVATGVVETFTGYSATSLIVSTQAVERDSRERLMVILADQVVARLVATAGEWRP